MRPENPLSPQILFVRDTLGRKEKLSLFWFGQTGKAHPGEAFLLHFDNSYNITQKKKKSRKPRRMYKLNSLVGL